MRHIILVLLSLTLVSCNSNGIVASDKREGKIKNLGDNTELIKLEKRRERWENADKCLRAMDALSNKVDQLCSSVKDIYTLAKGIGTLYSGKIVKAKVDSLDGYEKQLKEGIIDELPEDTLSTISTSFSMINDRTRLSLYHNDRRFTEMEICDSQAYLAGVSPDHCNSKVRRKYDAIEERRDAKFEKSMKALDYFKDNYKPSP